MPPSARASALLLLAGLAAACATTEAEKEAAFLAGAPPEVAGVPTAAFLEARRVILVGGPSAVEVEMRDGRPSVFYGFGPGSSPTVSESGFSFDASFPEIAEAVAVPLPERGFFLTAAHATTDGPLHLLWFGEDTARAAPAEIVWRDEAADVALLRADLGDVPRFEWAASVRPGERVLVAGLDSPSAGRVTDIGDPAPARRADGVSVAEIEHDAPVRDGDSGAPVVDLDGRLLAVHSATTWRPFHRVRLAARPDPAALRARCHAPR